jgi:D-glycero-beta-D-manno-heptose-7-phosphate kinase
MYSKSNLAKDLAALKILVIGDVMLDTYWMGTISRISPEAPVPILEWKSEEKRLGGAANVALNLASLGVQTHLCAVIGNDEAGENLAELLKQNKINFYPLIDTERPTTEKTRVISRSQHVLRIDKETTYDLDANNEEKFIQLIKHTVTSQKPDVIIFEDYNKGALTEMVILETLALANSLNIITTVDPKRKNFFAYKNATIFKPNLKEITEALGILDQKTTEEGLHNLNKVLFNKINHEILCLTLSEKGMYYNTKTESKLLPTFAKKIADVSGAGDTVIATLSALYAITKNINLSCQWANIAAGLVCEEVGTVPINKEKFIAALP